MKWKPSRTSARAFAEQMDNIALYCDENKINQSSSGDSYYFTHGGKSYRVSNHTTARSNAGAYSFTGEQVREKYHKPGDHDMEITAGKTRIIEIHQAIVAGKTLDRRGNVID